MTPIDILIPDGSLDQPTVNFFARAGIELELENRGLERYRTNQPFIRWAFKRRPQEIPIYLAKNFAHLGITGEDWWIENCLLSCYDFPAQRLLSMDYGGKDSELGGLAIESYNLYRSILRLPYSKKTPKPIRIVLAVLADSPYQKVTDLPPYSIITSEYLWITWRYLCYTLYADPRPRKWPEKNKLEYYILPSHGKTEQKLRDGLADAAIDAVETGKTLETNNLRIIETILESYPVVLPNLQLQKNCNSWPAVRRFLQQLRSAVPRNALSLTQPKIQDDLWLFSSNAHS